MAEITAKESTPETTSNVTTETTETSEEEENETISADSSLIGSKIIFGSDRDGNEEIYIITIALIGRNPAP